jgi:sulfur carrier protein
MERSATTSPRFHRNVLIERMEIQVNGKTSSVADNTTLADVVQAHSHDEDATGVAVAVNETVVPRREWPTRRLAAGDVVEIIHAVQGG